MRRVALACAMDLTNVLGVRIRRERAAVRLSIHDEVRADALLDPTEPAGWAGKRLDGWNSVAEALDGAWQQLVVIRD